VVAVRNGLSASLAALVVLLTVLQARPGMGLAGWATGLACGIVLCVATARCAANGAVKSFGPADLVTLARATLSCGVAALVAESLVRDAATGSPVGSVVAIATVALVLDAVDGRVARATGTVSGFGARLDGEADAFLMLVLSLYVAGSVVAESVGAVVLTIGVLSIGAVRYLFAMAGWVLPWMRGQLPPRYWRKIVTATAGIALVFAAADIAAPEATYAALAVPFVLLAESFGRDVVWLWRHRLYADRSLPVVRDITEQSLDAGPARLLLP
jgi:phosphatidylglycerophosphate synthase